MTTHDNTARIPWVQLKIGDTPILSVPPKYLQMFRYNSTGDGSDSFEIDLIDPEFEKLELLLFRLLLLKSDGNQDSIQFRFGYPDQDAGNPPKGWRRGFLTKYLPEFVPAGLKIHLVGACTVFTPRLDTQGVSFPLDTRLSDIVAELAKRDPLCERATVVPTMPIPAALSTGGDAWVIPVFTQWHAFVREYMCPLAVSELGNGPYILSISVSDKEVYFGPRETLPPTRTIRVFTGQDPSLKSFRPGFSAETLADLAQNGAVSITFNPDTKTYRKWVVDPVVKGSWGQRGAGAILPSAILSQLEKDGYIGSLAFLKTIESVEDRLAWIEKHTRWMISGPTNNDAVAELEAHYSWLKIYEATGNATAEFIGDPETLAIRAGDVHNVQVILPSGNIHWSSGLYRVMQAAHTLSSDYGISVDYQRAIDIEGQ